MGPVIAEALAGKRIAITGATGFVGTALVERLLRGRTGLPAGAARPRRQALARRPAGSSGSSCATTPSTACAVSSAPTGSTRWRPARITTIAGDVGTDGLGLSAADRDVLASCDVVLHSAAAVSFDSPLDSAVEINLLGPMRIAQLLQELGVRPHLVSVSTCYVAGNRRGTAPEELVSAGPFDLGLDWRDEVAAARRLRGDAEAASRQPDRLVELRKAARTRARRRRRAGAGGEDRAAARALGARPARRGRPGPRRQRRLARRLRLHEGPRRAGPDRHQGRRAGEHRAPVDHRVRARRAASGLDPRLPDGRAGAHLLRQGSPARVPRRARGHRRRDPRRPRRGRHHHRRRPRTGRRAGHLARWRRAASTR